MSCYVDINRLSPSRTLCNGQVLAAAVLYKTYILLRLRVFETSLFQQEVSLRKKPTKVESLERNQGMSCGRCITSGVLALCQPLSGYFLLFIK